MYHNSWQSIQQLLIRLTQSTKMSLQVFILWGPLTSPLDLLEIHTTVFKMLSSLYQ